MDHHELTSDDLEQILEEQIIFLINSCLSFDQDWFDAASLDTSNECEFKRIALIIRVLLHDTYNSKSLFEHLGLKQVEFINTSTGASDTKDELFNSGLVVFSALKGGAVPNFWFPKLPSTQEESLAFEKWWNDKQLFHKNGTGYSRKDLILIATNKHGGAHVDKDKKIPVAYHDLMNTLGYKYSITNGKEDDSPKRPGVIQQTIRQIAHEVLLMLQNLRPDIFNKIGFKVIFWPRPDNTLLTGAPSPIIQTHKKNNDILKRRLSIVYLLAQASRHQALLDEMDNVIEPSLLQEPEVMHFEKQINSWVTKLMGDGKWP